MKIVNNSELKSINNSGNKSQYDNIILKEDLERLYIDERKSMLKISKIYKCSWHTIEKRLNKYEIPIRSHGAFLVADDGESLNSKRIKGEISDGEYYNILLKNRGFSSFVDYQKEQARKKGFKDDNEYNRKMRHERDNSLSMNENESCSSYLGVYIAENILSLIFEDVERMPVNNKGYDFICSNGYKIDVKSACLSDRNSWTFHIKENKIADYFLMIAFDNRENLNVVHVWSVKCDAVIKNSYHHLGKDFILNKKSSISIHKGVSSLKRWKIYEKDDVLKKAQKLCVDFKSDNKCEIEN